MATRKRAAAASLPLFAADSADPGLPGPVAGVDRRPE
jgi:hypothetical protein